MIITVTATASGSLTPPTGNYPDAVKNGDFTITGNPGAIAIGEGEDEETRWVFDFNADPAYQFFTPAQGLTSAVLTLTLTPRDSLVTTDLVRVDAPGFGNITGPIVALPVNVTSTIQIDLLAQPTYTPAAILAALSSGSGKVPMVYGDDSIISSARLELSQQTPAYQYAVKFVCGKSEGRILSPGSYFTAINVHNPTYKTIRLRKKFAVGLPSEKSGPASMKRCMMLSQTNSIESARLRITTASGGGQTPKAISIVSAEQVAWTPPQTPQARLLMKMASRGSRPFRMTS